jgi:hypothetical protein
MHLLESFAAEIDLEFKNFFNNFLKFFAKNKYLNKNKCSNLPILYSYPLHLNLIYPTQNIFTPITLLTLSI